MSDNSLRNERVATILERHAGQILIALIIVTIGLIGPMLRLSPTEYVSTEPGGEVFELRDEIERKLASPAFVTAYVAEARDGDMLTQAALSELLDNQNLLKQTDKQGGLAPEGIPEEPLLTSTFDTTTNIAFTGVATLADAVDITLSLHPLLNTTLVEATDDQVKFAVAQILSNPQTSGFAEQLSIEATKERREVLGQQIDYWSAPALVFVVLGNNELLGGGSNQTSLAADRATIDKEYFSQNVQRILRGSETAYQLWGIAIDTNLEAEKEGATAGIFITLTVITALLIVGLSLRSYWATALTAIGIGGLMIWLKGLSALAGIKAGLIIDFIVPIAMVSLGVDFAVHAVRRYKEERETGHAPRTALRIGFVGVLGALTLAMVSDSIAFLSNIPSGIEAIVHFGSAAGIAVASSFLLLGIGVPLALMIIEERFPRWRSPTESNQSIRKALGPILGSVGVAIAAGGSVIVMIAVDPLIGVLMLLGTALGFVAVPLIALSMSRRPPTREHTMVTTHKDNGFLVGVVTAVANRPRPVLLITALLTALSLALAMRLEVTMDVKDFFDSRSDFVVGLDKLDEHLGEQGGEGGIVFVQGDLSDPSVITTIDQFILDLSSNPYIGQTASGSASVFNRNLIDMLNRTVQNEATKDHILKNSGTSITDENKDGFPDTKEQIETALYHISAHGIPLNSTTASYTPEQVRRVLYLAKDLDTDGDITILYVGIPGTRDQGIVRAARKALEEDLSVLSDHKSISRVGLTGSPFTRDEELSATVRVFRTAIPIAAVGAFLLLLIAMRSLRFAIVTIIPIGLVVAWLYGIMYATGFALNFVTATIGAVSIGVGIDFSIHFTERYREELQRTSNKIQALRQATSGTGTALVGSASSSIAGFAVMGFAPMPMFASYGMLTAIMITLALIAALFVLPALLMLTTSVDAHEVNIHQPRNDQA